MYLSILTFYYKPMTFRDAEVIGTNISVHGLGYTIQGIAYFRHDITYITSRNYQKT